MQRAGASDPRQAARARLAGHVAVLAAEIGERHVGRPAALARAADYIEDAFRAQGYAVSRQVFEAAGATCWNLEATAPGAEPAGPVLLAGAHYDTVPGSPGADDNASGVAALLEISGRLARERLSRPVRFVAFANEEPPLFGTGAMGSRVYATQARRRKDRIAFMLSLESVGYYDTAPGTQLYPPLFRWFYPDRGDFVAFVSNLRSRRVMHRFVSAFRQATDMPAQQAATFSVVPGVSWSDHASFWKEGYRAFMVTDTAFYRNPHYHTPADTPETLDLERLERATEGLAAALLRLATG